MGHYRQADGTGVRRWRKDGQTVQREVGHELSRYHNHLDSSIISAEWTTQEEVTLYEMH